MNEKNDSIKVVMTLLVRNEIDIIEQNIQFHLNNGVDFIIATDNKSNDGTLEILEKYARRGLVFVIQELDDNYAQATWVTRMARMACNVYDADWVIHNDADEFWWTDVNDLKKVLHLVPYHVDVLEVERYNFISCGDPMNTVFSEMIYKRLSSKNTLGVALPPKVIHRNLRDIQISQGNHAVLAPEDLNTIRFSSIEIFHFPVRSFDQYQSKIKLGGAAYERNKELPHQIGRTWRNSYQKYLKGELLDEYNMLVINHKALANQIEIGEIVIDKRLQMYMADNYYRMNDTVFRRILLLMKSIYSFIKLMKRELLK